MKKGSRESASSTYPQLFAGKIHIQQHITRNDKKAGIFLRIVNMRFSTGFLPLEVLIRIFLANLVGIEATCIFGSTFLQKFGKIIAVWNVMECLEKQLSGTCCMKVSTRSRKHRRQAEFLQQLRKTLVKENAKKAVVSKNPIIF